MAHPFFSELSVILEKMIRWAAMGKVKSFLNQDEVSKEIVDCHQKLSDCITKLQVDGT
jgi:hypothetical protein